VGRTNFTNSEPVYQRREIVGPSNNTRPLGMTYRANKFYNEIELGESQLCAEAITSPTTGSIGRQKKL